VVRTEARSYWQGRLRFGLFRFELAAAFEEFLAGAHLGEGTQGGLDDVGWIFGTQALGQDVADPGSFHHGADGPTGDNARSGAGWFQKNLAATESTELRRMMQGLIAGLESQNAVYPVDKATQAPLKPKLP